MQHGPSWHRRVPFLLLVSWVAGCAAPGSEQPPALEGRAVRADASASRGADDHIDALAEQILETMVKVHGSRADHRPVHAKGLACEGTFVPTDAASAVCIAPHFRKGASVKVTARLSDGAPDPSVADGSPDAGPRGLAVRFALSDGASTDIVAMSHNGFVVATGEEFLALQQAVVATDPTAAHPWPIEQFLAARPAAMKFVVDNRAVPESFANEAFFGNDTFVFVGANGVRQAVRYRFEPIAGVRHIDEAAARSRPHDYLVDDLKERLAREPIAYRLVAQLPNAGDPTADPSVVWPDDRRTIELGTIRLMSVVSDPARAEQTLGFDPIKLTEGIEMSDDELPRIRSRVYALSRAHRRGHATKP